MIMSLGSNPTSASFFSFFLDTLYVEASEGPSFCETHYGFSHQNCYKGPPVGRRGNCLISKPIQP